MNSIQVLDCTLRDGGYVNDWQFGDENAKDIVRIVSESGVDYVELAFIRYCNYIANKMEFNDMQQITNLFRPSNIKLSAMVEIGYGYPASLIPPRSSNTVDLIRLVVWKRMMKDSYIYAQELIEKGYEVGIQATRTEQYNDEEFAHFVDYFSSVNPKSIYIVDTFGLLTKDRLLAYASIADKHLGDGVSLGYHAHNNMQQAFSNMIAITEHDWNHPLMIDASVMGIGRGAGNLCLELLEKYLNENHQMNYKEDLVYEVAEKYINPLYEQKPWGYSIPYLLTAINGRNPNYVSYVKEKKLSLPQMAVLFRTMRERDLGIIFDSNMCDSLIKELF